MAHTLGELRSGVDRMKGARGLLMKQVADETARSERLKQEQADVEKARAIVNQAALITQSTLRMRLELIGTTALQSVFEDPNQSFSVTFATKAGRTECLMEIDHKGVKSDPMDTEGGGLIGVLSFALRCTFWSLHKTRPVLILDEPFHGLDTVRVPRAADMIATVAKKLGLQIIMVTHTPEFNDVADAIFNAEYIDDVARVTA